LRHGVITRKGIGPADIEGIAQMSGITDPAILIELDRKLAETRKLMAESDKFVAEQRKLIAEADKFTRERLTLVISATAAATLAIAAVGGIITKFLGL